MKKISVIRRMIVMLVLIVSVTVPASAQFKIGPRIGLEVNNLHFNDRLFDSDNRAGFTGGLEAEFMIPAVGFGLDASVMYVRRNARFMAELQNSTETVTDVARDYISIPVNLKWKINIPLVASIVKPYLFTGPEFAFLTSKRAITDALRSKKSDVSWNFGLGVELINHLQVGASYGIGISKATEWVGVTSGAPDIDGKNRYWTVTAAWLF